MSNPKLGSVDNSFRFGEFFELVSNVMLMVIWEGITSWSNDFKEEYFQIREHRSFNCNTGEALAKCRGSRTRCSWNYIQLKTRCSWKRTRCTEARPGKPWHGMASWKLGSRTRCSWKTFLTLTGSPPISTLHPLKSLSSRKSMIFADLETQGTARTVLFFWELTT